MISDIIIKGARTHNLKNIDVTIPRNKLVVITGMSGSGKSSLAFDTIYAEGQRRYVESLSAYARQFLDQMDKPDVDSIEGLSPAVSVEQKSASHNPRSTVGTVTEIYDYLRLFFARVGQPFCYRCGKPIAKQTVTQIVDRLLDERAGVSVYIATPVAMNKKGDHAREFDRLKALGFTRVKVDGKLLELEDGVKLDKGKKHDIDVVVDRLRVNAENRTRLAESLESALKLGEGTCKIDYLNDARAVAGSEVLSVNNACVDCGISYPKIEPQMFSFNSPQGACPKCNGLGELMYVDEDLVVPNESLSINKGAIVPWFGKKTNYYQGLLEALAHEYGFSLDEPFSKLPKKPRHVIFEGSSKYLTIRSGRQSYTGFHEGVKSNLMRRYQDTDSEWMRGEIAKFMSHQECPECKGARLKKEALFVRIAGRSIFELTGESVARMNAFFKELKLSRKDAEISRQIVREIRARLEFLLNVGLNYLTLNRKSHTLSGGEAQRIRLATQIGSALVGVTYVLDEPSIGLHQRDNDKLIATLKDLRDMGNTVVVVEHDEDTILSADHVIDLGPRSGVHGGELVYAGDAAGLASAKSSLTGRYLSQDLTIDVPKKRRDGNGKTVRLKGAGENNLKNITAEFPLGRFICVTGVSGSGKSTLMNATLYPALMRHIHGSKIHAGKHGSLEGAENVDKVINIDQSPIGRTPRSNPATYTGLFTHVRELYAELPEAKARGYKPGRFSFNVKGGRCERCEGDGVIRIEMHFLPDVFVKCEECEGRRFNRETLEVTYKGKNVDEVLRMPVEAAHEFFQNVPPIARKCETLSRVGLGYIELGQAATTLSGGEAQRIKLARELSKRGTGKTLYFLDEPTTGLHFEDIRQLLSVLAELVDQGNTVVVIEHNLHVIKMADYVLDLGPEGGEGGGEIIAAGTPEEVAANPRSYTGKYLKPYLRQGTLLKRAAG
jgi:excinuclease ABC subunit A